MLSSEDIYTRRRLRIVLLAATQSESSSRAKLTRRDYFRVDVEETCEEVLTTDEQIRLRIVALLLLGVVRVHQKQVHYAFVDSKEIWRTLKNTASVSAIDLPKKQPKPSLFTLPDPLANVSPNSTFFSEFEQSFSIPTENYFRVNIDLDWMQLPETPEITTQQGPLQSSPFTADPKDITLPEVVELPSLDMISGTSDSFGDEESVIRANDRDTLLPLPSGGGRNHEQADTQQDGVELFDEELGEFKVCWPEHETAATNSSQPNTGNPEEQKTDFEIGPGISDKHSQPKSAPLQRRSRKPKQRLIIDKTTRMRSSEITMNLNSVDSLLTTRNFGRFSSLAKRAPAKKLLSEPACVTVKDFPKFRQLFDQCMTIEREEQIEFELEDVLPQKTHPQSHNATPSVIEAGRGDAVDLSDADMEMEVGRAPSLRDGETSSNETGVTLSDASGTNSTRFSFKFDTSTSLRRANKLIPPTMGALSPMLEEPYNFDQGGFGDDSYGSSIGQSTPLPSQSHLHTLTSPHIESEPRAYSRHVTKVMGSKAELEFQELLPPGSSRKSVARSFSHILTLATQKFIRPSQPEPYGPIVLSRGTEF